MSMGELGVSDKEAERNSSNSGVGLGMKVQRRNLEPFPSKTMTMMVPPPHNHHDPPQYGPSFAAAGDVDGPTICKSLTNYSNHFVNAASATGAALVRPLQPFHVSASTAFKSSAGGAMATSLGFPFTKAQWKELERQAMIYKYMMASTPVPPHLLIPLANSPSADTGFSLRFSSSSDAEPGRCRRTDGKKWRCSRDVAPNHKYCERHMHRGRPRSRKHVEIQATTKNNQQINRTSQYYYPSLSTPPLTITYSTIRKNGSSSPFLASTTTSQPYAESSLCLDKLGAKAANFDSPASVPRGVDRMLKGDPNPMDPQCHPQVQNKLGLNAASSCDNDASMSITRSKGPLYTYSYDIFSCERDQSSKRFPLHLNPLAVPLESPRSVKPRASIDAWSSAETNANRGSSVASSNNRLLLSSLDLTMRGVVAEEDTGSVHMGLGQIDPPASWADCSNPGGPLAEILRPSKVAATTNESPMATMVSSPSGVLQRTLASFSDSGSGSSTRPRLGLSRATSVWPCSALIMPNYFLNSS